jgi:hypothetical protein
VEGVLSPNCRIEHGKLSFDISPAPVTLNWLNKLIFDAVVADELSAMIHG